MQQETEFHSSVANQGVGTYQCMYTCPCDMCLFFAFLAIQLKFSSQVPSHQFL